MQFESEECPPVYPGQLLKEYRPLLTESVEHADAIKKLKEQIDAGTEG